MKNQRTTSLQLLLTYLRPQKWTVALLTVLMLAAIAVQLINPQIMRTFLDGVQNNRPLNELINFAALFIILAVVRQVFQLASTYVGEVVAWTATNDLRADLAYHCLKLDMGFHKVHKPGELIERVDGDINQLATFFSQLVIRLSANLVLCTGAIILLWTIDWTIGLTISVVIFSGILIIRFLNTMAIPRVQALREIEATLFGYVEEWLHGTETIRSNAAEPFVMQRLYQLLRERWHRGHASMKLTVALNGVPNTVFSLAYITVFTLGAWRFFDGRISIGTLYITFYYIDLLRDPLWQLTRQIEQLQRAQASINRINELFAEQPTILDRPRYTTLPSAAEGMMVEFDQLEFAYADEPETPVLQGVNFTLKPGTILGLLGRTGSGKTTLTKLLIRFYDPTGGAIRLGDGRTQIDLREVAQSDLRRQIGVVTQQVQLFNATVRDNLTLFDDTFADENIEAALRKVGLHNWLDELPNGLDTHLAADGGLSAGEAQLLAFTRVFLADPQLIILDEASSRLDPATEQLIEKALDKLLENRTAVIVAHRLATVYRADEIMILSQGRVVEHDRREALVANPDSHFYQLLQTGMTEAFA
ncbi:MAG: ABC transporter ATP-binding protein [Ardenticatenaceae bacterium]|nr:ABC transporter ATP-binding protein [Ardenticatenaceae bacterium]